MKLLYRYVKESFEATLQKTGKRVENTYNTNENSRYENQTFQRMHVTSASLYKHYRLTARSNTFVQSNVKKWYGDLNKGLTNTRPDLFFPNT